MAVAALAVDLRPAIVEPAIPLRDADFDAPDGVLGVAGHQSDRVGVSAQTDVDVFDPTAAFVDPLEVLAFVAARPSAFFLGRRSFSCRSTTR